MEYFIQLFGFMGLASFLGFLWLGVVSWGLDKVFTVLAKYHDIKKER